jgi:hypothetical protein
MDLQSWVLFSEIAAGIAVVITLVILIISIRQNTRSQKVVAVDSLAAAIAAINVPAIESHKVGAAVSKAITDWDSASREERIMAHYFLFSFFKLLENGWYQRKARILDRSQWQGWDNMLRKYYHSPGVKDVWWPNRSNAFSPSFQDYLSETTEPEGIGRLSDIFEEKPIHTDAGN